MSRPTVLIVDTDGSRARVMLEVLRRTECRVFIATNGAEALLHIEREKPDVVLFGSMMKRGVLEEIWGNKEPCPPLAIFLGSFPGSASLAEKLRRALGLQPLKQSGDEVFPDAGGAPEILGGSACMAEVRRCVAHAARSALNVLIAGETGTGKELVARAIHRLSDRGSRPLVVHNCATTPPDLFDSYFFGHVQGAFTGATRDQAGLLAEADGSYLFLDELETLSLSHQAKLLRVLEDGEVRPVGSRRGWSASVRYLATTNLDPRAMMAAGTLREDLFHRLREFEIALPPLREHAEDIPTLVKHFLGADESMVTAQVLEAFAAYSWPGNVRELRNVIRAARGLAVAEAQEEPMITLHHLAVCERGISRASSVVEKKRPGLRPPQVGQEAILEAIREAEGNLSEAARRLGLHRSTLWRRLRGAGIEKGV